MDSNAENESILSYTGTSDLSQTKSMLDSSMVSSPLENESIMESNDNGLTAIDMPAAHTGILATKSVKLLFAIYFSITSN